VSAEQPLRWEEELLMSAARETSWPATPDLRTRVLRGVAQEERLKGGVALPRQVALAAVALLVAAVLVVLAVPRTRTAVADFFGLVEGYRIEVLTPTATASAAGATSSATPVRTPTPAPTATLLHDLAKRVTLEEAAARIGFEPALPPGFGEPEVYILDTGYGVEEVATVVLRYPTFDLWEARTGGRVFLSKGVPNGTVIDTVTIHRAGAYWVGDVPRRVRFVDESGVEVPGPARLVTANVLVWNAPDRGFYRIETDLPLEEALRIAESLP
jgi:hypothetical protein